MSNRFFHEVRKNFLGGAKPPCLPAWHYLNALCHFGPCHADKQKVWHILQAFILTYRVTYVLFWVNCIKKQAEVLPRSRYHGGALVGLSPPKQSSKPPNWNMKHDKTVMFVQISECQASLHKCKAPLYTKLFISHFFGNNAWIVTPSMSLHS